MALRGAIHIEVRISCAVMVRAQSWRYACVGSKRHRGSRFLASDFVLAAENRLELRRARLVASLLLDPCRSTALEVRTKPPSATATEHSPEISPAPDRAAPTVDRWRAKLTAHPRRARTGPAPQNRTLAPEWMEVDDPSPGSSGRAATFGRALQPSVRPLPRKRDQRCRPPTSNPVAPCGSCPLLTTAGPGVTIPLASARSPRPLDLHRPTSSSPLPQFCLCWLSNSWWSGRRRPSERRGRA